MEFRAVFNTDRYEESSAFYEAVLGLKQTESWDNDGDRGCLFQCNGAAIELLEGAQAAETNGMLVSIEVSDADAKHGAVVSAGGTPESEPVNQPWGHRTFAVADPIGVLLVFFEVIG